MSSCEVTKYNTSVTNRFRATGRTPAYLMKNRENNRLDSSFRDPAGFLFRKDGVLLRQVNESYAEYYDACIDSGLFDRLIKDKLLIPHVEVDDAEVEPGVHKILRPDEIAYVSYPYEWSFSQLKDAALLTLEIQRIALDHGLILKDASAYNVQFHNGQPIFIDTLSFEKYVEGRPWVAYRQFCQHFLAPLSIMAKSDIRLRHLTSRFIDGIPLDLASNLLPVSSYLRYSILAHIHMHARSQEKHGDDARSKNNVSDVNLSRSMLVALITSLQNAVEKTSTKEMSTEWGDYYQDTNYSPEAMQHKETLVDDFLSKYANAHQLIHDLGANTGNFSKIAARHGKYVVAHDIDEIAVERHYCQVRKDNSRKILPLILDLSNPAPALGWDLRERMSFHERAKGSFVIALALIHHICISNNVPLRNFAEFLASISDTLIIEFVPKEDSQVQRLLATRKDIFDDYTTASFERTFSEFFEIREQCPVNESYRTIYAMTRRSYLD